MAEIYSSLAHQYNLALVVVAGLICMLAAFVALSAYQYAVREPSRRRFFVILAATMSGLGTWTLHFIAMLAYEPGFSVSYDLPTTLLAVPVAIVISGIGWAVALDKRPMMAPLGGAIIGSSVVAMQYVGMQSLRLAGEIVWDHDLVIASVAMGVGLSMAAVWLDRRRPRDPAWAAGTLLTLAICSMHFTAMAAVTIYPRPATGVAALSVDSQTMAILVTCVVLMITSSAGGMVQIDRRLSAARLVQAQHQSALADEILRGAAEREQLTADLRHQAEISAAALDNMAQGLSMYDADDRLVTYNRRYVELYGLPEELLKPGATYNEIAKSMTNYLGVRSTSHAANVLAEREEDWVGEHELSLPNGRIIKYHRRSLPSGGWVATHEDVTEARRSNQQIAYLAAHDTLTGLPNRASLAAHLDAHVGGGKPFAVHTIDLDRFKEVNDTLGHPIGDEILKGAATRLREVTGKNDIVTRLGGDEFAVIQGDISGGATPAELAGRIVERLCEPFEFQGHTIVIGASVGISLAPKHGIDGEELLKLSDLALYNAKEESRGTYRFFEPGMDSRLSARRQLETDLRVAITEGQFELHYQPLLDMTKGTISSFEALVRWRHPTRGLVPPNDFIGTAEDSGLIIPIGEWVLRQACRDAACWPDEVGVSVNVSPAQFKRGDLIAMTMSALAAAGLAPARLELEITEAVLLHDEAWVHSLLDRLSALGVRIAMDDFGTGYSSLSYLRSFPFNKIKIDRSFIADLVGTSDALSIVQATIQLSQKLGMEITAEGVETAEQLDVLVAEGCTQVQGFHVSRAVPVNEITGLLRFYNGQPHSTSRSAG